jgi:hypothetical protein
MDRDFLAMLMEYIMSQQQGPAVDSPYGAQGDIGGLGVLDGPAPVFPVPVSGPMPLPGQGNRANTPPRTGMLPNGNPFPGRGEGAQSQRLSASPPPSKAAAAKKRYYPVGYTGPRDPDPSPAPPPVGMTPPPRTPATPRPTRPIPAHTKFTGPGPKGISFPIQAAKRIQQAATAPQIAKPMPPGTLRSATKR